MMRPPLVGRGPADEPPAASAVEPLLLQASSRYGGAAVSVPVEVDAEGVTVEMPPWANILRITPEQIAAIAARLGERGERR